MATDPNNPEVLVSVPSEPEAATIVVALADRGIEATTTGSFTAGFHALVPSEVDIVVKHKDLVRAKEALGEIARDQNDVDWSQVDVGEPEA